MALLRRSAFELEKNRLPPAIAPAEDTDGVVVGVVATGGGTIFAATAIPEGSTKGRAAPARDPARPLLAPRAPPRPRPRPRLTLAAQIGAGLRSSAG